MDAITYLKRIRHLLRTSIYYRTERFKMRPLTLRGRKFAVGIADSVSKRRLGLMYRDSIGRSEGMLFVYDDDSRHSIWMFNTRFRLDVVWLDRNKKVVDTFRDARPCKSIFDCPLHLPKRNSRYTLELPEGAIKSMGLKAGDQVRF